MIKEKLGKFSWQSNKKKKKKDQRIDLLNTVNLFLEFPTSYLQTLSKVKTKLKQISIFSLLNTNKHNLWDKRMCINSTQSQGSKRFSA